VVKEIDSQELAARLESGEQIHVIDIRSDQEVAYGCLPQARHLPMHLLPMRLNELPSDGDVVLYCRSGARSFHAGAYLSQQGFKNVLNLRGGIIDWARNGLTVAERPLRSAA
jgi:rhodanese-related sulfurtransferase